MYLRWRKRERQTVCFGRVGGVRHGGFTQTGRVIRHRILADGTAQPDVRWTATLVESRRVNGKPKQTHVAYLGGMTESGIEAPCQRGFFWEEIGAHLDRLSNRMTTDNRKTIEAAIAKKVPPLSEEELAECRRDAKAFAVALQSMFR